MRWRERGSELAVLRELHGDPRCETCRAYLGAAGDMGACESTGAEQFRYGVCLSYLPQPEDESPETQEALDAYKVRIVLASRGLTR